jgi:hypothetical protein
MKSIIEFLSSLIAFLPNYLFGVRAAGEKIPEPTFRTVDEAEHLDFNEWCLLVGASKGWRDREPVLRAKGMMSQWGTNWNCVAE